MKIFILLICFIAVWEVFPRAVQVTFDGGSFALISPAGFLGSTIGNQKATIFFHPKHGPDGTIGLWQDTFDGPIILVPTPDQDTLLCLYNFDVDMRVFRINPNVQYKPLPQDSALRRIVLGSPWDIEPATLDEWHDALNYLKTLPPKVFARQSVRNIRIGPPNTAARLNALISRMEGQVKNGAVQ